MCARLGVSAPIATLVGSPRPIGRMPAAYVEPESGLRVGTCIALFLPRAGAGRGRVAYLAEYKRLQAAQYAVQLKMSRWQQDLTLPATTFRNPQGVTVTLVQEGSALVTVVGTGR